MMGCLLDVCENYRLSVWEIPMIASRVVALSPEMKTYHYSFTKAFFGADEVTKTLNVWFFIILARLQGSAVVESPERLDIFTARIVGKPLCVL